MPALSTAADERGSSFPWWKSLRVKVFLPLLFVLVVGRSKSSHPQIYLILLYILVNSIVSSSYETLEKDKSKTTMKRFVGIFCCRVNNIHKHRGGSTRKAQ